MQPMGECPVIPAEAGIRETNAEREGRKDAAKVAKKKVKGILRALCAFFASFAFPLWRSKDTGFPPARE
jgi:hypothetical protein